MNIRVRTAAMTVSESVLSSVIDPRFGERKRSYLLQTLLATACLAAVLIFEDALANAAIVTAIASSAFLLFVNPGSTMAQPRRAVGGHLVALVVALVFSLILYESPVGDLSKAASFRDCWAALAVGTAILGMAVTNTEHAPAAGTVLGLVIEPWSIRVAGTVAVAVIALAFIQAALRRKLIDLV
jgi:CBS-domain-containing membrane protein